MDEITVNDKLMLKMLFAENAEEVFMVKQNNVQSFEDFIPWMKPKTVEDDKKRIEADYQEFNNGTGLATGIFERVDGRDEITTTKSKNTWRYIGMCGILRINRNEPHNNHGELGYWLDREHWGKGIVTKCCQKLIEVAFQTMKLDTLRIVTHRDNRPSVSVAKRLNFTLTDEKITDKITPSEDVTKLQVYVLRKKIG